MHAVGIHSALAIKRQRKRRDEQKRAKERRYSTQSSESCDTTHSPRSSMRRKHLHYGHQSGQPSILDTNVVSSIGMLHIGVVFVFFGVFLLGAGILPDDISNWNILKDPKSALWNELVCTGLFAIGIGVFLIVLNSFISKKEEEDLESYVQRQLTRSRSGHRLERDVETGHFATRHNRRMNQLQKENTNENLTQSNNSPLSSEVQTPTTPHNLESSNDMLLEKILEEESTCSFGGDDYSRREQSLSPNGNDKKYLLEPSSHHSSSHDHHHHSSSHNHNGHALHMTNI